MRLWVNVDKLTELQAIGEDELIIAVIERDVGGAERIGELDVEVVVGPEGIRAVESEDDADDLEESGAVVTGDACGGIMAWRSFRRIP